jgi:hypothetical protein
VVDEPKCSKKYGSLIQPENLLLPFHASSLRLFFEKRQSCMRYNESSLRPAPVPFEDVGRNFQGPRPNGESDGEYFDRSALVGGTAGHGIPE